jgi:hypothetical protein
MKIDLHLHTMERSSCSIATENEQIKSAIYFGLSGVAITDHNRLVPRGRLAALNAEYAPFRIFTGIEIRTVDTGDDFLVIGLYDEALQEESWTYEKLRRFIRKKGAFLAYAHPYRFSDMINKDVYKHPPHAVEIHSTNIGACDEALIRQLAERLGVTAIACSDAHNPLHVGIYHLELTSEARNDAELIEILRASGYQITGDLKRIERYNHDVREREKLIRQFIQNNKSAADYRRETGIWEGLYERVAMGKSYEI